MGVHGLWKLIEPSGTIVLLESLEGKILAVDISIWLHQAVKGFQDSRGASVPNAHLLTLYNRICKLLYFRIKPVFVFDGGVPALKRETIAKRNQLRAKHLSEVNDMQKQLISSLLKHSAVSQVLSETTKATLSSQLKKSSNRPHRAEKRKDSDDLFVLPPSQTSCESEDSPNEEEIVSSTDSSMLESSPTKYFNIHDIDETSDKFRALPADVRHEILTDLKETRKQNSWGRIHELPKQSDDFSGYQMQRLLKRNSIQTCLEEAEKEMGGASLSLNELESLLNDHGVITENKGSHIASDENTRYLYIKDVKKTLEQVKNIPESDVTEQVHLETSKDCSSCSKNDDFEQDLKIAIQLSLASNENLQSHEEKCQESITNNKGHVEFEDDLQKAIKLSLQDEACGSQSNSTSSANITRTELTSFSTQESDLSAYLHNLQDEDFASSEEDEQTDEILQDQVKTADKVFSVARNYMIEYGGLTQSGVDQIFGNHCSQSSQKVTQRKINFAKFNSNQLSLNSPTQNKHQSKTCEYEDNSMSSTDDDFIEVDDKIVDKRTVEKKVEVEVSGSLLEIQFNTNEKLEDDMFSDIFKDSEQKNVTEVAPLAKASTSSIEEAENREIIEITDTAKPSEIKISTNNPEKPTISLSVESLKQLKTTLAKASEKLQIERESKERLAGNITDQMYKEAQDLLRLFGIPYIVAPMEAEAQCAFLDEIHLTNGTITDDSDIWLFGGHTVYKNFFNKDKEVLEFKDTHIERYFKLNRYKLISLALLVGSDYTIGIQGIGPVSALEVLAAFTPNDDSDIHVSLNDFRRWFVEGRKARGRTGVVLRKKLKNIQLHDGFPSLNVIKSYLEPSVDTSKEPFTWGKIHRSNISIYAEEKFGWNRKKIDSILDPLMRRISDTKGQKRINDYFQTTKANATLNKTLEIQDKLSKRLRKALGDIDRPVTPSNDQKEVPEKHNHLQDKVMHENSLIDSFEHSRNAIRNTEAEKKVRLAALHKKESIPQLKIAKSNQLQARMKAIEIFRKSKQGPGYLKKRNKVARKPENEAALSESSESD